jgi:hypothetical protein
MMATRAWRMAVQGWRRLRKNNLSGACTAIDLATAERDDALQ